MRNIFALLKRFNTKDVMVISAFLVALTGAAGLGLATRQFSSAASVRDSGNNPIFNANTNGGIGCLTAKECVDDLQDNKPGDIRTIANHFGLSTSEYSRFEQTARMGKTYKNGTVVVDGQTVITNANSMGRDKFNAQRKAISIGGNTYYYSRTQDSFAASTDSIDTLVMFNDKGVVETALMTACGNPTWGDKVVPEYDCKSLKKTAVSGKKDTYSFTTDTHAAKGAKVSKVVYDFGDGSAAVTKSNPSDAVTHTYSKPGTYTAKVTVHFDLPGKQTKTVASTKCATNVTVAPKEEPKKPVYACDLLVPTVLNDAKTKFRFTVRTSQANGATLKDVDFTVSGTSTVTGVTEKDTAGNIFKEYEFPADNKERTITVKVKFLVNGQTVTAPDNAKCAAKITPTKQPVCPIPGKEHLPPESDQCVENCPIPGKEHLPKGSAECEETETPPEQPPVEVLPNTGMGSVLGIFAGTTAAGAVAHRWFVNRRNNG